MSQRTYMSGSCKRKLKSQRDESTKKLSGSLLKYTVAVTQKPDVSESKATVSEVSTDDTACLEQSEDIDKFISTNESKDCVPVLKDCSDADQKGVTKDFPNSFESDPALWTVISNQMIDYFIKNPPPQNLNILPETQNICCGIKRSLTIGNFYHVKKKW